MKKIFTTMFLFAAFIGWSNFSNACTTYTPVITPSGPTTFCVGNSLILTSATYASYQWSNGATTPSITVTTSGTYGLTTTDGMGCTGVNSQTVTVVMNPIVMITPSGPTTFAIGDSVILDAGVYPNYVWSNGATTEAITVTATGSYWVTVTDNNGCTGTASQIVTVTPCSAAFLMDVDTIPHHYIIINNAIGVSPIHYDWSWGDSLHDTIPYPTHTYADTGYYTICLTITDAAACSNQFCLTGYHVARLSSNTMATVTVRNPFNTGICDCIDDFGISVYPNPTKDHLNIHTPSASGRLTITNILGSTVFRQSLSQKDTWLDISALKAGIYFYEINGNRGRFIKE